MCENRKIFFYGRKIQVQLSLVSLKTMACIAEQTESDRNFFFYFLFRQTLFDIKRFVEL